MTARPGSGAVDLVGSFSVVVVRGDGFVESLEQRTERFAVAAHEHGHRVVAIGGGCRAVDGVELAEGDLAAVLDQYSMFFMTRALRALPLASGAAATRRCDGSDARAAAAFCASETFSPILPEKAGNAREALQDWPD